MAFDIGQWTVRVLMEGLPSPVSRIERGETLPVARWVRRSYGAVLFIRLWRNGQWDSDCAVTSRGPDGRWLEPISWGGGGGFDPLDRPEEGWDGEPVEWIGESGGGTPDDAGYVRTIQGQAARVVAAIEVRRASGAVQDVVPVDSPYGAVVVGVTDNDDYVVTPLDIDGNPLALPNGEIASMPFEKQEDMWPKRLHERYPSGSGFMSILRDSFGRYFIDRGHGEERIQDPELIQELKQDEERREEWRRRRRI